MQNYNFVITENANLESGNYPLFLNIATPVLAESIATLKDSSTFYCLAQTIGTNKIFSGLLFKIVANSTIIAESNNIANGTTKTCTSNVTDISILFETKIIKMYHMLIICMTCFIHPYNLINHYK